MKNDEADALMQANPTLAVAVLGKEVELFLDSDIGKYLVQCAEDDIDTVMSAFSKVNPQDAPAIMALQVKLGAAIRIKGWLGDAINSGKQAVMNMETRHE